MKLKKITILISGLLIAISLKAQYKHFNVFVGGHYFNNVSTTPFLTIGGFYQDYFSQRMNIRLQGDYSFVQAQDNQQYSWDAKFLLEYNFFRFYKTRYKKNFTPYVASGLGMTKLPTNEIGYSTILPVVAGLKFRVGYSLVLGLEGSFNWTGLDMLYHKKSIVDWYALFGFYFSFVFSRPQYVCPAYR